MSFTLGASPNASRNPSTGRIKDIQIHERAHRADLKRKSRAELERAARARG
jgi:hypothetical protein